MAYVTTTSAPVVTMSQMPAVTVVRNQPEAPAKLGSCAKKGVAGLSISQLVMGFLCIVFEIALMVTARRKGNLFNVYNFVNAYIGPGIWNGAVILITGFIGILTAKYNKMGLIIAYMVVNIVVCVFFITTFISLSSTALVLSQFENSEMGDVFVALNALLVFMAVAQFIITIVAASLCCSPTCCRPRSFTYISQPVGQQTQAFSYPLQTTGQQTMIMTNGMQQPQVMTAGSFPSSGPAPYFQQQTAATQPPAYTPVYTKA